MYTSKDLKDNLLAGTLSALNQVEFSDKGTATYTVSTVPAVGTGGASIYVSDASGASLTGSLCFSNGTVWIDVTTGAAVA